MSYAWVYEGNQHDKSKDFSKDFSQGRAAFCIIRTSRDATKTRVEGMKVFQQAPEQRLGKRNQQVKELRKELRKALAERACRWLSC